MSQPVIGWARSEPVPNGRFNAYLHAKNGRLFYDDLDLAGLFLDSEGYGALPTPFPSPLELAYLPMIGQKIRDLQALFDQAISETGYAGQFHYAYASKANTAEEVVRSTLRAGAHHEMSSNVDVTIAQLMVQRGWLTPQRMVLANGFKYPGSSYAQSLLDFKQHHDNLIPIVEDLAELRWLLDANQCFDVGLRQKSYGHHGSVAEMDEADSRFGLNTADLMEAARIIEEAPNLRLTLYHAMIGSQLLEPDNFVERLRPSMQIYAHLRRQHPALSIFNFGGGMPAGTTLDFAFDYQRFATQLLRALQSICQAEGVPVPDIMGEFGRYTTAEHGAHLFKIVAVKERGYDLPWYILDGSIMTSFPDSWAIGEHFIVLPLTNLDKPFRQVRLGGITCDSDDFYPPRQSQSPLYLPVDTNELYIGFFGIGAYQEMLGGVRGSKHCVLPEAGELIIDRDEADGHTFHLLPGQTTDDVLRNLWY